MHARTRLLFPLLSVAASSIVTALALLRLTVPTVAGWFAEVPPGLLDRWIAPVPSAVLSLLLGLAGIVTGLRALVVERSASRRPAGIRIAAAALAAGVVLLAPGGVIPVAGYTFALVAVGLVVAAIVLLTLRHPVAGLVAIAGLGAAGFVAVRLLDAGDLLVRLLPAFARQLPFAGTTAVYLVVSTALVLWAIGDARPPYGRVAAGVLRHRRAITIVAAACALPYALARASWLTPWPQFGGNAELFAREPAMLLTGLLLGAGMLTGGVLTLGLIRPWGERFSSRFALLGDRPVPVGLAVIPAVAVAVLFLTGGLDFLLLAAEGGLPADGALLEAAVLFPFWLWGPLLALAAWGYAMHRASEPLAPVRPRGREARRAAKDEERRNRERALAHLEALEDRDPEPSR